MKVSEDPEFYDKLAASQPRARGLLLPFTGKAVSAAKGALLNLIEKEEERLTKTYRQAQSDLYFYHSTSENHPMDPTGMQFDGLTVTRFQKSADGRRDTTFFATFSVDTSNAIEILNNSIFRLKLEKLMVRATLLPGTKRWFLPWTWFDKVRETINLDVNIRMYGSWVDENLNMKRNEPVGEFFLVLREVPLEGSENYERYIKSVEGMQLSGYSYLIPRSVSFQRAANRLGKIYGHGLYSLEVDITESRRPGKVSRTATEVIERSEVLN